MRPGIASAAGGWLWLAGVTASDRGLWRVMYAKQVGNQVALVMDEEQAEELYALCKWRVPCGDPEDVLAEIAGALGSVMEG